MRKIFKNMAWMLTATLVMAACSDSLDESSGNGNSNEFTGDKGYVNIGINLPTTPSTRAESFNDGKAEEYKVDKVIIALFYGGTEKEAECKCAFQLTDKDFLLSDDATNNITSYYATGVRMISAPEDGEKVYALAIVNPIDKFGVGTTTTSTEDSEKENAGDAVLTTYLTVNNGTGAAKFVGKLSDLNKVIAPTAITDVTGSSNNYFLMTNAPISTKASFTNGGKPGDLEIQTLAPIKVYNDKALAEGASKDNPIYVERAVAKTQVAVEGNDATLTVTTDVTSYKNATVKFEGWKLQNTNKKYYPVRRVNALDSETDLADINTWLGYFNGNKSNRFIGITAIPYRTYWGIDPNYDKNEDDSDLSKDYNILSTVNDWNQIGYSGQDSEIEYCLENTTTAKTMAENRLTSVLLKATFTPADAIAGTSFFMINNTSAIYTAEEFLKVATAALKDGNALTDSEVLAVETGLSTGLNITDATGVQSLLQISNGGTDSELSNDQAAAILAAAGGNIKYYLQGVTYYYATVIKHFGEAETPLASTDAINAASDYDENRHLGRYGVLRNNWYELTIKSVKGPGEPEIPEIPTTPPDKQESYINCEINVLSWAKRSQGVDL